MKTILTSAGLRLIFSMLLLLALASCGKHGAAAKPPDVEYYTCTMHPSVKSQDPNAKCPICAMDLVPVRKSSQGANAGREERTNLETTFTNPPENRPSNETVASHEFMVPVERQQQIGVTYGSIEERPLTSTIRTVGLVSADKKRHWEYVTRVEGYVEKLFVFSTGEMIESNAPLLTIYSPDLLTTENELLELIKTQEGLSKQGDPVVLENTRHLVESARQRLRLWNITDAQIDELEKTRHPQQRVTLESPFKGIVQDLSAEQGGKVMAGERLVDLVDLSEVWVWAEFYENEVSRLRPGLAISITTSAYEGEKFDGKISLVDPFLNGDLRTVRVRIDVNNPSLKLRPQMYVNVELNLDAGKGLVVPVPAVLLTGQRNITFVDKGEGKLEPRFVQLGKKYGDFYELLSGLSRGERVVTSANFLVDAEAQVQGALKGW